MGCTIYVCVGVLYDILTMKEALKASISQSASLLLIK